jgi:hypothetical protein
MKLIFSSILFLFITLIFYAQTENLITKFNLPEILQENSGLIYFNDRLILHNDSGGQPNLYEIDTKTGLITRIIHIKNAKNMDWEDITQDNDFIYIGDFGNNNGTRKDLKIYKINKQDYLKNNTIKAKIINFSYNDQTNFSYNSKTNFNAEAFIVYNNNLLIFTKNHGDLKTKAYILPKQSGIHTAKNIGSYKVKGLITGATISTDNLRIFLSGYSVSHQPFVVYLADFNDNAIFSKTVIKTNIGSIIGKKSQLEGITNATNNNYYLSREKKKSDTQSAFVFKSNYVLDIDDATTNNIRIYKNPFASSLEIKSVKSIEKIAVFNLIGILFCNITDNFEDINLYDFTVGSYILKIYFNDGTLVEKKLLRI